jgi:hypothetical protein
MLLVQNLCSTDGHYAAQTERSRGCSSMARAVLQRARLTAHETESTKTLTDDGDALNKKERESSPT